MTVLLFGLFKYAPTSFPSGPHGGAARRYRFCFLPKEMIMKSRFACLIEALSKAVEEPPKDLVEAIRALPPVGTLLPPWTTWLYFALSEHRERQRWGRSCCGNTCPKPFRRAGGFAAKNSSK
jgi:hypothetical protein